MEALDKVSKVACVVCVFISEIILTNSLYISEYMLVFASIYCVLRMVVTYYCSH